MNNFDSSQAEDGENLHCIFLHIVEGTGLIAKDDFKEHHFSSSGSPIVLNASLNAVKFEIEGYCMGSTTIFNNNCIWQCEMDAIKRMKMENRPVKVTCYQKTSPTEFSSRNAIGTLLLPLRGIQSVASLEGVKSKLHWHKLGAVSGEWRANKPELLLLFVLIRKSILSSGDLDSFKQMMSAAAPESETASMLHSQSNIYVKLLDQVGLIQVGNSDCDCDIFAMHLTFKHVRNVDKFLELDKTDPYNQAKHFLFHYELLGTASTVNVQHSGFDSYAVNDRLSVKFKTSLSSLRLYFQRVFFVPISLFLQEKRLATYCLTFDTLLPDEGYFRTNKSWLTNGSFHFDRLHIFLDPSAPRPTVDFDFSINLLTENALQKTSHEMAADFLSQTFGAFKNDKLNVRPPFMQIQSNVPTEADVPINPSLENFESYVQMTAKPVLGVVEIEPLVESLPLQYLTKPPAAVFIHQKELCIETHYAEGETKRTHHSVEGSDDERCSKASACVGTDDCVYVTKTTSSIGVNTENTDEVKTTSSIGVNTENTKEENIVPEATDTKSPPPELSADTEELTYKIVQELEAWKSQQMEVFLKGLERKEREFLVGLDEHWCHKHHILQASLEAKIAKVDELSAKLQGSTNQVHVKVSESNEAINVANTVKNDMQKSYEMKFVYLEKQIRRLKHDMTVKGTVLEEKNNEIKSANSRLEAENAELKQRLQQLEGQMSSVKNAYLPAAEIRDMVTNVREQNGRCNELENTKNYYKSEWVKTIREMNKLKLAHLKHQERAAADKKSPKFQFCLDEILAEEKDALDSERSELKLLENLLSASSDNSSSLDECIFPAEQ